MSKYDKVVIRKDLKRTQTVRQLTPAIAPELKILAEKAIEKATAMENNEVAKDDGAIEDTAVEGVAAANPISRSISLRTTSTNVQDSTFKPQIIETQMMHRSEITEIRKYGVSSCQITRTYGLIMYALSMNGITISLDRDADITMLQKIMKLFYPETSLFGTPDNQLEYIGREPRLLKYLQDALTFSSLSDIKCPNLREITSDDSLSRHFNNPNDTHFDTIRTFAIIKHMVDGDFPIHYFNIVKSSTGVIFCHTAWGANEIKVQWRKFPIDYDLLMDMDELLKEMIDNGNYRILTPNVTAESYRRGLYRPGERERLYIVELLDTTGLMPLVHTVAHVLSNVDLGLAAGAGGSIKNKKRTRRTNTRGRTKTRGRTRTRRRTKKTYKKR